MLHSKPGHVLTVAVQLHNMEGKVDGSSAIRTDDEVSCIVLFPLNLKQTTGS